MSYFLEGKSQAAVIDILKNTEFIGTNIKLEELEKCVDQSRLVNLECLNDAGYDCLSYGDINFISYNGKLITTVYIYETEHVGIDDKTGTIVIVGHEEIYIYNMFNKQHNMMHTR